MVTKTSKPLRFKKALLRQLPTGEIQALSSDGHTIYGVTLGDNPCCTCPAGSNGRHCYHLTTAKARYGHTAAAASEADAFIAWLAGEYNGAAVSPETDPEPPTPAAARPALCQKALYPDCACPACQPAAVAA